MIGAFLLVTTPNRRQMAHSHRCGFKRVDSSTPASNGARVGTREYPRSVSAYTIRTPSPGGQYGGYTPKLPAFFLGWWGPSEQTGSTHVLQVSAVNLKGRRSCLSKSYFLHWEPVQALLHAARHWVSKRSAEQPSARAHLCLPAAACSAARPSVQGQTCLPAKLTSRIANRAQSTWAPCAQTVHPPGYIYKPPAQRWLLRGFCFGTQSDSLKVKRTSHV